MDIKEQLLYLADLRDAADAVQASIRRESVTFMLAIEDKTVELQRIQQLGKSVDLAVREAAIAEYARTQDKHPSPGVNVNETTLVTYDAGVALAWAIDHRLALSLDVKAFEKIRPMDIVTVTQVPKATIAVDIRKALCEQHAYAAKIYFAIDLADAEG